MDVEVDKAGAGHDGSIAETEIVGGRDRPEVRGALALTDSLTSWGGRLAKESTHRTPVATAGPLIPSVSGKWRSQRGNQLRPDRNHPDKQRDRRQCGRLFNTNPQHCFPPLL